MIQYIIAEKPTTRKIQFTEFAKAQFVNSSSLNKIYGKKRISSNNQAIPSKKFFIINNDILHWKDVYKYI